MKTFQEFLEQAGSPTMAAHQQRDARIAANRAAQSSSFKNWGRKQALRRKAAQNAEMHNDLERIHALP